MENCRHGVECPWLAPLCEFVDISYVPAILCDMIDAAHTSFAKKKKSNYTEGSLLNEIYAFHMLRVRNDKKNFNEIHAIKLNIIEAMRVAHNTTGMTGDSKAPDIEPMRQHIKTSLIGIQNMMNQMMDGVRDERVFFTDMMDKVKSDNPVEYTQRSKMSPYRRQREECFDWTEEAQVETPKKIEINFDRRYEMKMANVGIQKQCGHMFCKWREVWEVMQEMCGAVMTTSVPANVCTTFRRVSTELNTVEAGGGASA